MNDITVSFILSLFTFGELYFGTFLLTLNYQWATVRTVKLDQVTEASSK